MKPYHVICVDLDRTLIHTDLLHEAVLWLLRQKVWLLFFIPFWLVRGKAYLKHQLAKHVPLDVASLPYNSSLIDLLKSHRDKKLVLATATPDAWAKQVADFLGIFSEIHATTKNLNLKGKKKAELLEQLYGGEGFCYIGDSSSDLPVWKVAQSGILVTSSSSLIAKAREVVEVEEIIPSRVNHFTDLLKSWRMHHWIKNLLLFVPLVMAHEWGDSTKLIHTFIGLILFSVNASAVYLLNDLFDLESDRHDPSKKQRSLACGKISIPVVFTMVVGMTLCAFVFGWYFLGKAFCLGLLAYTVLTLAYSVYLKKICALDVLLLASFYSARIYIGGILSEVPVSAWLMAFSMFFFLNLAFIKRYSELRRLSLCGEKHVSRRGYDIEDLDIVRSMGAACGYISILVFTLYINGETVIQLYRNSQLLWLVSFFLLYWVTRIWLLTGHGKVDSDPIIFVLKDRASYVIWLLIAALFYLAI